MWQGQHPTNESYIPQTEQHEPKGLMLLRLGNVTIIYMNADYISSLWFHAEY